MALAPDGRILVAEQGGRGRVVKNGQLLPNPLMDLSERVDSQGERGLVGLTLDPEFARGKPFVYVYYTLAARNGVNPRVKGVNKTVWALGLRNPYSFAIQPGTGSMFINDVGAREWEEINRGVKGVNYGWPVHEGPENDRSFRGPFHAYRHQANTCSAITGGAFYNPRRAQFPSAYTGTTCSPTSAGASSDAWTRIRARSGASPRGSRCRWISGWGRAACCTASRAARTPWRRSATPDNVR